MVDDFERHRSLLGVIPVALPPMFEPFVQLLLDLGITPQRLGSLAVNKLHPGGDPRLRLLAIPFPTEPEAFAFSQRVHGEVVQRHDLEQLLPKIGPALSIQLGDTWLLFWFGVMGNEITRH